VHPVIRAKITILRKNAISVNTNLQKGLKT